MLTSRHIETFQPSFPAIDESMCIFYSLLFMQDRLLQFDELAFIKGAHA